MILGEIGCRKVQNLTAKRGQRLRPSCLECGDLTSVSYRDGSNPGRGSQAAPVEPRSTSGHMGTYPGVVRDDLEEEDARRWDSDLTETLPEACRSTRACSGLYEAGC